MQVTHRPISSSLLRFISRILEGNPKKELLRGLWQLPLDGSGNGSAELACVPGKNDVPDVLPG